MTEVQFRLQLYTGETSVMETDCLSLSLEREAYTPYTAMTAEFLDEIPLSSDLRTDRVRLLWNGTAIFHGIAERIERITRNGVSVIRVQSKTFPSLLTQNELEAGLHTNLTIGTLVQGFYYFPWIGYQHYEGTGYVFVKEGKSLWDSIVNFGYRLTGHYPYTVNNTVRLTLPEEPEVFQIGRSAAAAFGRVYDTSRLVSHYHMEDINGNPNAYQQENPVAAAMQIVRHKHITLDRQYLDHPMNALTFRNLFSQRGWRAKYVTYEGFANEEIGGRVTFGSLIQNETVCRVRLTFGVQGVRTTVWVYEDGFYNNA